MTTTASDKEPVYKACGAATAIRLPNGAYSFAKCTLLVCDGKRHQGEHKFALLLYEMIRKDQVIL